jgi:hypothetical protein
MSVNFLSTYGQLENKIQEWAAIAGPTRIKIDYDTAYSGHHVYAITLTDFSLPAEGKTALYFAQPHAHEPATTAGMIDVIEQLVTGKDLAGKPSALNRELIFAQTILTFNPMGNPFGSERAPYPYWDGSKVTNDRFHCLMFGEDPDAPEKQWNRLDTFDIRKVKAPDPIGIAYEPIDEYTWVEPNRSQLSSYAKLFRRMNEQYPYKFWLDMHQTEFEHAKYRHDGWSANAIMFMPLEGLPPEPISQENRIWANEITDALNAAGFHADPPIHLPYHGIQADYFRKNWGDVHQKLHHVSPEIKNNGADVPPERQLEGIVICITTTINRILTTTD